MPGHDVDLFDDFCEHLLVRECADGPVIGTYRVLTPAQAKRVGRTYSDTEFDLTRLRALRPRMVELGRSCVHPDHRHGGVIMVLWGALAGFMERNSLDVMMGCASIPMLHNGVLIPNAELGHLEIDGHDAETRAAASIREREALSWPKWAARLQRYYTHLENLLWPDLFVVGGGVSRKAEKFLPLLSLRTPIVPATLQNAAGIIGAAALAAD